MPATIDPQQIIPLLAIAAGLLVLFVPRSLSYVVALVLIVYGLMELRVLDQFLMTR